MAAANTARTLRMMLRTRPRGRVAPCLLLVSEWSMAPIEGSRSVRRHQALGPAGSSAARASSVCVRLPRTSAGIPLQCFCRGDAGSCALSFSCRFRFHTGREQRPRQARGRPAAAAAAAAMTVRKRSSFPWADRSTWFVSTPSCSDRAGLLW